MKKLLALLIACMLMLSASALAVTYDLSTLYDSDGTVSLYLDDGDVVTGSTDLDFWIYSNGKEITLSNVTINGTLDLGEFRDSTPSTLKLEGVNTITQTKESHLALSCCGPLVFTGSGSLTASGSTAISAEGDITVEGGSITANGTGEDGWALFPADGALKVTGGTVTAQGTSIACVNYNDSTDEPEAGRITLGSGYTLLAGDSASSAKAIAPTAYNGEKYLHITEGALKEGDAADLMLWAAMTLAGAAALAVFSRKRRFN